MKSELERFYINILIYEEMQETFNSFGKSLERIFSGKIIIDDYKAGSCILLKVL